MPTEPSPAPIVLTTYRRLDHVKRALDALADNPLASESELFITSDGPREADRKEVMEVREFVQNVPGFRNVHHLFRDKNDRYGNWLARREVLEEYGRLVFLEEDCLCAPGFLQFINQGLVHHQDDPEVFSIAGYSPPIPAFHGEALRRARVRSFNPWGFGIWKDRDASVDRTLQPSEFNRLIADRSFRKRVMKSLGPRYFGMLRKVAQGNLCAYDLMAMLTVIKNGWVSIFPSRSFVRNTGFDGSGENCGTTAEYEVQTCDSAEIDFSSLPCLPSTGVDAGFANFFGGTWRDRMKFLSKRVRGRLALPEA